MPYAMPSQHAISANAFHADVRAFRRSPSAFRGFVHSRKSASLRNARVVSTRASATPTLYDVPVSNNGARVRLLLYWKGMESQISIQNPSEIGGLKSEEYLSLNPQGKMPLLVLPDGLAIPESEVISQYVLDEYSDVGPLLIPSDAKQRALATLATRIHDIYIVPIQGCMYRGPMDIGKRAEDLSQIYKQLDAVEKILQDAKQLRVNTPSSEDYDPIPDGPFICGQEPCFADAGLFPTWVFFERILPRYFGWKDVFSGRPLTQTWFEAMCADTCGERILLEIRKGLDDWHENGRWDTTGVNDAVKDGNYTWKY